MCRQYCNNCSYPLKTCVCAAVENIELPVSVKVIQHYKEKEHAKNTVRLAKLISPQIEIIDSRDQKRISTIISEPCRSALLYPNLESRALEDTIHNESSKPSNVTQLIFIDGTWKQAHSIWKQYKLERNISSFHFSGNFPQAYNIRSSKRGFQLSTIEAIAYSLSILYQLEVSPFHNILNEMQSHWPQK